MADKPMRHHSIIFERDPQAFASAASTTAVQSSFALSNFCSLYSCPSLPMASNSQLRLQHQTPMAPPPLPAMTCPTQSKKLDINSLMSPPDLVLDSFNHLATAAKTPASKAAHAPGQQPPLMSPPVSPLSKPIVASADSCRVMPAIGPHSKDPVLYPSEDHSSLGAIQAPLFVPAELEQRRIVEQHVRARSQHDMFALVSPPRREDYELILSFKMKVLELFRANPSAWLRKERALLQADRRAGAGRWRVSGPSRTLASKAATKRSGDRVHKASTTATTTAQHKAPHANASSRQTRKISGASSLSMGAARAREAAPGAATGRVSLTPEPSRRGQAPNREDKNFDALPDYCPPLDSLPDRPNCLKTEWRGNPIDLTNDPYLHLLHHDEVPLAANLRLDCATYLTSKRRIFERRLQCLRTGKEFRKTDAQQACKIDVNKASKLWTAFEKVGWLNAHWVRQFL